MAESAYAIAPMSGNGQIAVEDVEATVVRLVAERDQLALDEGRRRAEAAALYEKRNNNRELADYYRRVQILAEAGLGALSYDFPGVIPEAAKSRSAEWRCLGAGLERHRLLEAFTKVERAGDRLSPGRVAHALRRGGWTHVPGTAVGRPLVASFPWKKARVHAREQRIEFSTLPRDKEYVARMDRQYQEQGEFLRQAYAEAMKRKTVEQRRGAIRDSKGTSLDVPYALLRRAMQALDRVDITQHSPAGREYLGDAMSELQGAEDTLVAAIRCARREWEPAS